MKILAERHAGGRSIRVFERMTDAPRLYFDGPALYTHVDANGDNLLQYIQAMGQWLRGAPEVLLLGTAGGALATQLSRRGVKVTAVDDWPPAFDIARQWFHLPSDVDCVDADALAFLRSAPRRWPAIAIDVFQRERIPQAFMAADIGAVLRQAIEPGGIVVWNVADSCTSDAVRHIENILRREAWSVSRVPLVNDDVGNTLVVGRAPGPELRQAA